MHGQKMKISLLCSNLEHPIYAYLKEWVACHANNYNIQLINKSADCFEQGDILFLISCSEIIKQDIRNRYEHTLVLHASDLPSGRGWSPHIWDILQGKQSITLSLLNAEDEVDSGDVWCKKTIKLSGLELYDEINHLLFSAELELISWACRNIHIESPKAQKAIENNNYYRLRTPSDSELDPSLSIAEQFNLLRVSDPNRFPAFFYHQGKKFIIKISRDET